MTPHQLELAARKLCELRGQNPEELVGHGPSPNPDGTVHAVLLQSPRWLFALEEIESFLLIQAAIDAANGRA